MWIDEETIRKRCRRFDVPGHAHELTFSCHRKLGLLGNDTTRGWLIKSISRARASHAFELWAYVIMPDHVHAIISPGRQATSVSTILRAIKQPVAKRAINHLKANAPDRLGWLAVPVSGGRTEHRFWQAGGGYDRNIVSIETLWEMIDYIHLNPVRRGLAATAREWKWSSAPWYAGERGGPISIDPPPR